jgi:hypothetical protein
MNNVLIACMLIAILAGATAAWMALTLGWGWLAAFALYTIGGTITLVATATLTALTGMLRRRPDWSQGHA